MKCEFSYCIYNEDLTCLLDEIRINSSGNCESCIMITLQDRMLSKYKKKQLLEIAKRYEK